MFHKIRWRIAIPYALLFILIMLGLGGYLANSIQKTQQATFASHLSHEAQLLANLAEHILADPNQTEVLSSSAQQWSLDIQTSISILTTNGALLTSTDTETHVPTNSLNLTEIQQALKLGSGYDIRIDQYTHRNTIFAASSIKQNNQVIGFIWITYPVPQNLNVAGYIQKVFLSVTAITLFLVVGMAFIIGRNITQPLSGLSRMVDQIATLNYEEVEIPTTQDEVGELALAIRKMADQIKIQVNELKDERSKFISVLQKMTDGVLIVAPQGNIQLINPAAERMFSLPENNVLGQSLASALRHHKIIELWRLCMQTGQYQVADIELIGNHMFIICNAIPLSQSLPGSTLLVFQDLTYIRRLETIRRDFISNISHELRTPLAALKVLTETLKDSWIEDPPATRRFLDRMETEVDALTLIVQELLELSRIESGKVPLKLELVSPCKLMSSAINRLGLQAERAGLEVQMDCPNEISPVLADPIRMEQVLVNLLHNAIKFTPKGGKISLTARQEEKSVLFAVYDTGIGIPSEDLPRIFERFFKSDRARSGGGTGLGLAITRHIIEAHGGRIWVESIEGQESTFYFTLPLQPGTKITSNQSSN